MIARTYPGLEEVLAAELAALGAKEINAQKRAVFFKGGKDLLYRTNFLLRSAVRVHLRLFSFSIQNQDDLYRKIQDCDWRTLMLVTDTLAVDAHVHSPLFNHSKFAALRTKDAIVDQFRKHQGSRPSVDTENPTIRVHVHLVDRECTVSLDSSGESLHLRGYRTQADKAPLNEVLAAGLVLLSGWDAKSPFIDPLCGAGTIPIEAGMLAYNIPPALRKARFGFFTWKDFDEKLWNSIREKAISEIRTEGPIIVASDHSKKAVSMARVNAKNAGLENLIEIKCEEFQNLVPPPGPGTLIMNPPYGERLEEENIEQLYELLGDKFKKDFAGWNAWVFSANLQALKRVGLKPSKRIPLRNGPMEARLNLYELYAGKKEKPGRNE